MNIDIKDTIILSDGNSYVVAGKENSQNNTYYYMVDRSEVENIKICVENTENMTLIEIDDNSLIKNMLPLFLESSLKAITKEDFELLEQNN